MIATIRRYKAQKGTLEEVGQRVQAEFVPLLARQPGFVSYTAVNMGDDNVMSVSVFLDRAAAEAANRAAAEWVKENIGDRVGQPEVTSAEVLATDRVEL